MNYLDPRKLSGHIKYLSYQKVLQVGGGTNGLPCSNSFTLCTCPPPVSEGHCVTYIDTTYWTCDSDTSWCTHKACLQTSVGPRIHVRMGHNNVLRMYTALYVLYYTFKGLGVGRAAVEGVNAFDRTGYPQKGLNSLCESHFQILSLYSLLQLKGAWSVFCTKMYHF